MSNTASNRVKGKGSVIFGDVDIIMSFVSFLQTFTKSCYFLIVSYHFFYLCVRVCVHCQFSKYDKTLLAVMSRYIYFKIWLAELGDIVCYKIFLDP